LLLHGSYQPMKVEGQNAAHVVAFAREYHGKVLLTIAARWFASLLPKPIALEGLQESLQQTFLEIPAAKAVLRNRCNYECPDGSGGSYRGSERCIAAERRRQPGKLTCGMAFLRSGIGTEMMSNAPRLEPFRTLRNFPGQVEIRPSAWHW